ncbi:pre-mRNA cleavage and polyadenylation factor (CPF) complex subunit [Batrachochytrium dendrobatidis]|nr:pre-mRNA cleavage and polyadenylation factor (CPF) complex subunit [Batrachochytrium dendrobatidis]KAK5673331.1 pre-mRNA cleavage and polyadenylation factor (CPF) complex subunit [Batrachochytrium dendrobatidis]
MNDGGRGFHSSRGGGGREGGYGRGRGSVIGATTRGGVAGAYFRSSTQLQQQSLLQQQLQDRNQYNFDGKRVRKAIQRRTVDYNSVLMRYWEIRNIQRSLKDYTAMQPEPQFLVNVMPPFGNSHNLSTSVTTKFIHLSANKVKCPINAVCWTPEGRRLITGASSGEFTMWNGLTFNFETILQAHDSAVRALKWSHSDTWMISADDSGIIKYWQSSMNNLKMFQGHKETVRDLTFSPTDSKFASCSDDGTIKIWSFADAVVERTLTGHGWDVKCLDWHPTKGILASGSKDNLAKLWDPRTGKSLSTLHGHKNTIMQVQWNKNGNWLLTACRDQLARVYDIRTMKELQIFKGHKREVQSIRWHPVHENMFVSGGWEGSMIFWEVGSDTPLATMEHAHDNSVYSLDWHPLGHMLVSGSNDHTTRWWTRNRPGDAMYDRYNVPKSDQAEGVTHRGGEDNDLRRVPGSFPGLSGQRTQGDALPGLGSNRQAPLSSSGPTTAIGLNSDRSWDNKVHPDRSFVNRAPVNVGDRSMQTNGSPARPYDGGSGHPSNAIAPPFPHQRPPMPPPGFRPPPGFPPFPPPSGFRPPPGFPQHQLPPSQASYSQHHSRAPHQSYPPNQQQPYRPFRPSHPQQPSYSQGSNNNGPPGGFRPPFMPSEGNGSRPSFRPPSYGGGNQPYNSQKNG